jgi:YacP-like NYN domain-containing protein
LSAYNSIAEARYRACAKAMSPGIRRIGAMSSKRLWIVDGHNTIFALGDLQRLQTSDRGAEARSLLVERLEAFAHRRGERVLVVFDGKGRHMRPDDRGAPLFQAVYGHGVGGADRLILDEARRRAERGEAVTVVTDDVRTLAFELPPSVRRLGVREFWLAHIDVPPREDEKPVAGDVSDIERAMLTLEPDTEVPRQEQGRSGARRPAPESAGDVARPAPRSTAALRQEALLGKRARGRLRQGRMLKRRGAGRGKS